MRPSPELDIAALKKALAERPANDAGATIAEMVEALGQVPTPSRCVIMRAKLRPLLHDGRLILGHAIRTQMNGIPRTVVVYRFKGGGHAAVADDQGGRRVRRTARVDRPRRASRNRRG